MRARAGLISLFILLLGAAPVGGATRTPARLGAPLGSGDAAIARTLRLPAATWLNDRDGNKVFDSLEARFAAAPGAPQETVVTLVHGEDVDAALERAQAVAGAFRPTHVFRHLGGFVASLRADQALRVASLDAVRQVEWAQPGVLELDTATVNGGVRAVQTSMDLDGDGDPDPVTGEGVTIAIMDSGFHGRHVDLEGKFAAFIDWSDGGEMKAPHDPDGHGTHVASIAAGLGVADSAYTGVAPGADLVGFLIPGSCSTTHVEPVDGPCGTKANALASIDWILANHQDYGIRVTTISYGFGPTVDGTDALELGMDRLWEAGIVPFKSAGNSGSERGTVTIPGGARGSIAVAAMHDPQELDGIPSAFSLTWFSSRGPTQDGRLKPDLAAYGSSIMAARDGTRTRYTSMSGTSMASPYAAGVAALVLDANPSLTNTEVRQILFETAEDWGTAGPDIEYGHGRIRAIDAVRRAAGGGAAPDPALPKHVTAQLSIPGPSTDAIEATIEVLDPNGPLDVTVIVRGRSERPVPDHVFGNATDRRALHMELLGPGQEPADMPGTPQSSRQTVFRVPFPFAGTYTLRVQNLGRADVLDIDVSAADVAVTTPS